MTDEQLRAMARRVLALVVEERMVAGTIPLKSPVYGLKDSAMAMVKHIDADAVAILREEMGKHDTVTAAELPDLFSDDPTQTIVIDT